MRFVLRMALGMLFSPFLIGAVMTLAMAPFYLGRSGGSLGVLCFGLVGDIVCSRAMLWQVLAIGLMTAFVWQAIDRHRARRV